MKEPKLGFEMERIVLSLDRILPIRIVKDPEKKIVRYAGIRSSIREIGVVEPLMVYPQNENGELYLLMDGHLRLHALKELGITEVECLVSTDDESFTYNARISRLSPIQEHRMIHKAVESGVPVERIAAALHMKAADIKARMNLLVGINPDTVELLKDKQVSPPALRILRKVLPIRQIEIAELMVSANNFTKGYAEGLLLGTPKDMLVNPEVPKVKASISPEELARMEKEAERQERDYKAIEDDYAENMLNLTVLRGYVRKLIANERVHRFLDKRHTELLPEFERVAATDEV
jgi:hypothetical protein